MEKARVVARTVGWKPLIPSQARQTNESATGSYVPVLLQSATAAHGEDG